MSEWDADDTGAATATGGVPVSREHGRRFTVAELAKHLNGELRGEGGICITGINTIADATASEITFAIDQRRVRELGRSSAAAAILPEGLVSADFANRPVIIVPNAELAAMTVLQLFAPPPVQPDVGVHPTAFVHETVALGEDVCIGPYVSIERGAVIGRGCVLHPGVRIYADVRLGERCELHANAVVRERCVLGARVVLHASAIIGSDGFGFRPTPEGLRRMPHIGNVVLGDDVEIGANSCVDRAKFSSTIIGAGTKIDNLNQIAHNCRVGRNCVITGGCALAGSVTVEDGVMIGGHTSVPENLVIGEGAKITGHSMVFGDIPPGEVWGGNPARPWRETLRQLAAVRKLVRSAVSGEGSARPPS